MRPRAGGSRPADSQRSPRQPATAEGDLHGWPRQLDTPRELSDREREILGLIAQGHKNADIAARLVLSPKTVRNHVTNILSKLQVADRSAAIVRAREAGLGQDRR